MGELPRWMVYRGNSIQMDDDWGTPIWGLWHICFAT